MVKVAILGFGFMGRTHADAYVRMPNARLVAVGGLQPGERVTWKPPYDVKFYEAFDAILQDTNIDVIDICVPTFMHEELVIQCAEFGKQAICEKPLAFSVSSFDRMIAAVQRTGVRLMVAQVVRFFGHYVRARQLVHDGVLGEVSYAWAARLSEPPRWAAWFQDPAKSGGALFDLHVHDVDYMVSLFGQPNRVFCTGVQSDAGAWNQVLNVLEYEKTRVAIEANYMMAPGWPFTTGLRVVGSGGSLEYGFRVAGNVESVSRAQNDFVLYLTGQPAQKIEIVDPDPYFTELQYFVNCIEKNEDAEMVPLSEVRQVLGVIEAARHSLETGLPVQVER
ncbi:MAG: Gfo/Idh/MocA family protein [Acidobacteriaceae bacterium]